MRPTGLRWGVSVSVSWVGISSGVPFASLVRASRVSSGRPAAAKRLAGVRGPPAAAERLAGGRGGASESPQRAGGAEPSRASAAVP